MAIILAVLILLTTPTHTPPQTCLEIAGLKLADDGYISISGLTNDDWGQRYRVYADCTLGPLPIAYLWEDGGLTYTNTPDRQLSHKYACLPLAVCNDG